jgi:hypothetical protein
VEGVEKDGMKRRLYTRRAPPGADLPRMDSKLIGQDSHGGAFFRASEDPALH